jgi:hypothetical protein
MASIIRVAVSIGALAGSLVPVISQSASVVLEPVRLCIASPKMAWLCLSTAANFTTILHSRTEHLPHASQIFHALELNGIQLGLRRRNLLAGWHSDVEVASFNKISRSPYQKDYDAVVDVWLGDKRTCFALEYERSLKSARQYQQVRQALELEQQVGCILYLTAGIEILVHLLHTFQQISINLAFANAPDFAELLLDTTVITHRNLTGVKFREVLE